MVTRKNISELLVKCHPNYVIANKLDCSERYVWEVTFLPENTKHYHYRRVKQDILNEYVDMLSNEIRELKNPLLDYNYFDYITVCKSITQMLDVIENDIENDLDRDLSEFVEEDSESIFNNCSSFNNYCK